MGRGRLPFPCPAPRRSDGCRIATASSGIGRAQLETVRQSEIGDHEGEDFGVGGLCAKFHRRGAGPRRGHERIGRRGGGVGERAGVDRLLEPEKPGRGADRRIDARRQRRVKRGRARCSRPAGLVSPPPGRCSASRSAAASSRSRASVAQESAASSARRWRRQPAKTGSPLPSGAGAAQDLVEQRKAGARRKDRRAGIGGSAAAPSAAGLVSAPHSRFAVASARRARGRGAVETGSSVEIESSSLHGKNRSRRRRFVTCFRAQSAGLVVALCMSDNVRLSDMI